MIVDTSAIIAVLIGEPDQDVLTRILALAPTRQMSAGSWVELEVVLSRRRDRSLRPRLDALLKVFPIDIAPVTAEQAEIGAIAYRTYGKGNHPAYPWIQGLRDTLYGPSFSGSIPAFKYHNHF